uniref:NR LBD domain-containing protein n=1 Tax=Meloidogyne hapla TaxID=6305 RepID=A0A1I8AXC7_MELHA
MPVISFKEITTAEDFYRIVGARDKEPAKLRIRVRRDTFYIITIRKMEGEYQGKDKWELFDFEIEWRRGGMPLGVSIKEIQTEFDKSNFVEELPSPLPNKNLSGIEEDVQITTKLVLIEKQVVWDLVDTNCSLLKPITTKSEDISNQNLSNNQIQKDIPFEEAFNNPTLICRRYPVDNYLIKFLIENLSFPMKLMFNRVDQPLTPFLYIDGWRRHFTYFIDWVHQLEPFQQMSFNDQILLAKQRITHVGWLVHAYNSQLKGEGVICFANCAFYHPDSSISLPNATINEGSLDESTKNEADQHSKIVNFFGQQLSNLVHSLFEPLRQLNLDFAEYVLLKAILLFSEEVGLSPEALTQIKNARTLYLRALFKYIRDNKIDLNDNETKGLVNNPFERMASILSISSIISTLKSEVNERVQISTIFNLIEFDSLMKDIHSSTLH